MKLFFAITFLFLFFTSYSSDSIQSKRYDSITLEISIITDTSKSFDTIKFSKDTNGYYQQKLGSKHVIEFYITDNSYYERRKYYFGAFGACGRYERFDSDLSKFLPFIPDQGNTNLCTSFAIASALTININEQDKKYNLTLLKQLKSSFGKDKFVSPLYIYNSVVKARSTPKLNLCKNGFPIDFVKDGIDNYGIKMWSKYDYDLNKYEEHCSDSLNKSTLIKFYSDPIPYDIDGFSRQLKLGRPIYLNVYVNSSFRNAIEEKRCLGLWNYNDETTKIGGDDMHSVLIVGYDKDKKAFKALHFKGNDKGDKGFLWIDERIIARSGFIKGETYLFGSPYVMSTNADIITDRDYIVKLDSLDIDSKLLLSLNYYSFDDIVFKIADAGNYYIVNFYDSDLKNEICRPVMIAKDYKYQFNYNGNLYTLTYGHKGVIINKL